MAYFNFPKFEYDYSDLMRSARPDAEIRAEYSRLRSVAKKRLAVFEKHGYQSRDLSYYTRVLKPLKELDKSGQGMRAVYGALADVHEFLTEKPSYSEQRKIDKKAVATLQEHGYKVTLETLQDFGNFMEYSRIIGYQGKDASMRVADLWSALATKQIPPDEIMNNFDWWYHNQNQLNALPKHRSAEQRTAQYYQEEIKQTRRKNIRKIQRQRQNKQKKD